MDKKSYGNILIYDVAYKTTYSAKLLHIIFDMVDGYVRKYDRTKYLALFHFDKQDEKIFDTIRYLR